MRCLFIFSTVQSDTGMRAFAGLLRDGSAVLGGGLVSSLSIMRSVAPQ